MSSTGPVRGEDKVILREASNEADMKKKLLERWSEQKTELTFEEAKRANEAQYSHNQQDRVTLPPETRAKRLTTPQEEETIEEAEGIVKDSVKADQVFHEKFQGQLPDEVIGSLKGRVTRERRD